MNKMQNEMLVVSEGSGNVSVSFRHKESSNSFAF